LCLTVCIATVSSLLSSCGSNDETLEVGPSLFGLFGRVKKQVCGSVCIKHIKSFGYDKGSCKVNYFAAIFDGNFHGFFFFEESTVTGIV